MYQGLTGPGILKYFGSFQVWFQLPGSISGTGFLKMCIEHNLEQIFTKNYSFWGLGGVSSKNEGIEM